MPPKKKIAYRTATLERPLPVPREQAWAGLTAVLEGADGVGVGVPDRDVPLARVPLSVEPPWRLVERVDGDHPSPLLQTTVTIRDDGETCLVAWSTLVDPTDVDPVALDALVDEVTVAGAGLLDRLEVAATR
ncbi:MAG: hypothetical protein AAGK32_02385 [Actinomycetota bacterium]